MPHIAKAANHIIPESLGFDADEVVELTRRHSSLSMFAAPTIFTRILNCSTVGSVRVETIKSIAHGGAPMYVEDLKRAIAVFGPRLIQLYGQAEMSVTITNLAKSLHSETDHPRYEGRLASTGIARAGVEVRIVDSDGHDLAPGEIGEVGRRRWSTTQGRFARGPSRIRRHRISSTPLDCICEHPCCWPRRFFQPCDHAGMGGSSTSLSGLRRGGAIALPIPRQRRDRSE